MNAYNLEKLIVEQNPHWTDKHVFKSGFQRDAFSLFCDNLEQNKLIITLSGPRRVGKTFLIKQSINWLITTQNIDPQNILYFQFSGSHNEKDIIHNILEIFLTKYASPKAKYIFFDEIQVVDYWQDQLKQSYDLETNLKFTVSGSTSLFYHQKSRESLAGRIVKLQLGVLSFTEYLRFSQVAEPSKNRAKFISQMALYDSLFKTYLSVGQYPELVVNQDLDAHKYLTDLADQIINFDIPYLSAKINRQLFWDVVKTLSQDLAEEFSANNLAKILLADRRTIAEYIKILEEVGLFSTCYNSGFKSLRKKLSSSKKIYSLSLNLSLHIGGWDEKYLSDTRIFGKYFENYVYIRLLANTSPVEYYRISGQELDFVTADGAYEVKSLEQPSSSPDKYLLLSRKLHKDFHLITPSLGYTL
jgi:hypothetical protein